MEKKVVYICGRCRLPTTTIPGPTGVLMSECCKAQVTVKEER